MVHRVMEKLIPASGLEHVDWEVHVIDSPECNAFVIPGGKVFVYTGILPVAKNDDGLAAILGHEIAHNLARHASESMSSMVMLAPLRFLFIFLDSTGYTMGLGRVLGDMAMDLGLARPASRKQESEADYIGLMMMARSCYNPQEAVKVWQRMEIAQKDQDMPEWLSTHPSNSNRITQMQQWLPKAEIARSESECAVTLGYSEDFKTAFKGNAWLDMFKNE
ncbi:peptidase family M48-domain-containing protein [Rhexocercosporidium sp. MPI-PUGE-AT-0058]|nr:peptidase family M48-domain-containing protein [Rhexocercosporidium sp. MPI-PUGE-AT-0058]